MKDNGFFIDGLRMFFEDLLFRISFSERSDHPPVFLISVLFLWYIRPFFPVFRSFPLFIRPFQPLFLLHPAVFSNHYKKDERYV